MKMMKLKVSPNFGCVRCFFRLKKVLCRHRKKGFLSFGFEGEFGFVYRCWNNKDEFGVDEAQNKVSQMSS